MPEEKREVDTAEKIFAYLEKEVSMSAIDIVHDSGGFFSFFFPVAYKLLVLHRIPFVLHFRYLLLKDQAAAGYRQTSNLFSPRTLGLETMLHETTQCFPVRMAHRVICLSNDDKSFIRSMFKPDPDILTVIPDPIDIDLYSVEEGDMLRKQLAKPGEKLLLFGGRIDSHLKGGDIVLRAFKKMRSIQPRLRLLLLSQDKKSLTRFQRKFGPAVTILGWVRDAGKLAAIFSAADLLLMPSRYESFGMMCAEAMAAGTPVVASPVGGVRDMIVHGQNGFLFSSHAPQDWVGELVDCSLQLLTNTQLARTLGDNARKSVVENLSIQKIAERIEQLYDNVLREQNRGDHALITPPQLTSQDKESYLDFLNENIHPGADKAGVAFWNRWQSPANIAHRCPSCTRKRVGTDIKRLMRLKRLKFHRIWYKLVGTFEKELSSAVEEACPLGLLQRKSAQDAIEVPGLSH
jgi:glycosyltransferase involved in cell wall biosynthesis